MPTQEKVKWSELTNFTDKQKLARKAIRKFKYFLYGGAMGGGKSYWLRWQLLELLIWWFKKFGRENVTVALFCEDYPALKDRHLSKIKFEFPNWLGKYNASDHNFVLAPEYGGGTVAFRNLDDASKYQSAEFAAVGVDELTKNEYETFLFLRTRMRWPGIDDVKFLAASNPGDVGHGWVKKIFLDKQFEDGETEQEQFSYLPATAYDNPHLSKMYFNQLTSLPEKLRKAFLEGNWDIFAGQVFTEWSRTHHILKAAPIIEKAWNKFFCVDWGYTNPCAVYWCAVNNDGKVIVYRELYVTGKTAREIAYDIWNKSKDEDISYGVGDPSIWSKTGHEGKSIAEEIMDAWQTLNWFPSFFGGDNERINGLHQVHSYLELDAQGVPFLLVSPTCVNLIRTLPNLVYDEHKTEDVDTDTEDHAYDAIRYGLMSRPKLPSAFVGLPKSEFGSQLETKKSYAAIKTEQGTGMPASVLDFEKDPESWTTE